MPYQNHFKTHHLKYILAVLCCILPIISGCRSSAPALSESTPTPELSLTSAPAADFTPDFNSEQSSMQQNSNQDSVQTDGAPTPELSSTSTPAADSTPDSNSAQGSMQQNSNQDSAQTDGIPTPELSLTSAPAADSTPDSNSVQGFTQPNSNQDSNSAQGSMQQNSNQNSTQTDGTPTPKTSPTSAPAADSTPDSNSAQGSTQQNSNQDSAKTPTPKPTQAPSAPSSNQAGVAANGQLQVIGTQLSNQSGSPIVLRGISTAGIAWFPDFATKEFMKTFRDEWGASVFRIAMYSYEGNNSYINNPSWNKTKVCSLIDAAIELDMYVIVDWHILADGNPQTYQTQAEGFFTDIASKYPGVPNILYEICNEPNGGVNWNSNIKPYAEDIIPIIRTYSPEAIIIVGTPTWSQDVDAAAQSPLDYENIMYALHFYAGTHKEWLRGKADTALSKGLPLFVTEWGTTDASGNGNVDTASSDLWLEYLEAKKISWCNWSLCNKAESSALLLPSAGTSGALSDSILSVSGKYVKNKMLQYCEAAVSAGDNKNSATANPAPDNDASSSINPASDHNASPIVNPVSDNDASSSITPAPNNNASSTITPVPSNDISTTVTPVPDNNASPTPTINPTPDNSALLLLFYNENRDTNSNTISPRIQIKNNSQNDVSLSKLAILYYYTPESDAAQNFWCDYAEVNGGAYRAITDFVTGTFLTENDSCMKISFQSGAGILAPGETASLQVRITNEDWSNYNQSNDSSFLPSASTWQEEPPLTLLIQE